MSDFSLVGTVIDASRQPVPGLRVGAFHHRPLLGTDTSLGEVVTDAAGRFLLAVPASKVRGFLETTGGVAHVFLTISDAEGGPLVTSSPVETRWQIEYHIRLGGGAAAVRPPDLYSQTLARMTAALQGTGIGVQSERSLAQLHLAHGRLEDVARREEERFLAGAESRTDQLNHFLALLDGLWSTYLEGTVLKTIGYDGPQVPRDAWTGSDIQVIAWPRSEPFRWA